MSVWWIVYSYLIVGYYCYFCSIMKGTELFVNIRQFTIYINFQLYNFYFQVYKNYPFNEDPYHDYVRPEVTNEYYEVLKEIDEKKRKKREKIRV